VDDKGDRSPIGTKESTLACGWRLWESWAATRSQTQGNPEKVAMAEERTGTRNGSGESAGLPARRGTAALRRLRWGLAVICAVLGPNAVSATPGRRVEYPSARTDRIARAPGAPSFADSIVGSDDLWSTEFCFPGAMGRMNVMQRVEVECSLEYQGELIVGGDFGYIDGVETTGLASWNGETWTALPDVGGWKDTSCLLSYGDTLVVGSGAKYSAGDSSCVSLWDGDQWRSIGSGLRDRTVPMVLGLVKYRGDLIASGVFQYAGRSLTPGVARWDGNDWHGMGSDSLYGDGERVRGLAVFHDRLFAFGWMRFGAADSIVKIAVWGGQEWVPMDEQPDGDVYAGAVFDRELVVAGSFENVGSTRARGLAAWNGRTWRELGGAFLEPNRLPIVEALLPAGDSLIVAGRFDGVAGCVAPSVATLRNGRWHAMGTDVFRRGEIRSLGTYRGQVIAGGHFPGGVEPQWKSGSIAAWDGRRWGPLGPDIVRLAARAYGLTSTPRGLLAAGGFVSPDVDTAFVAVGLRAEKSWSLLGEAFDDWILDLVVAGDRIYVAGDFTSVGGRAADHVAWYDPADGTWKPMGGGVSATARTLTWYQGDLVVGGEFLFAGGQLVSGVARWNGSSWAPLADGFDDTVRDLVVYRGDLIALGYFSHAGSTPCAGAARWDGAKWVAMDEGLAYGMFGPGLYGGVVWNDRLVVYGEIEAVNGIAYRQLASWDGRTWSPVLPVYEGVVSALGVYGGRLLVGGSVLRTPYPQEPNLVQYDGKRWTRPGTGVWSGTVGARIFPPVTSMAEHDGDLYVSGLFQAAGENPSAWIARWSGQSVRLPPPAAMLRVIPNPLRGSALLSWTQPEAGPVTIHLYDAAGRDVATLADGFEISGEHGILWQPVDSRGRRLPSGVYLARMIAGRTTAGCKAIILR
jgi:hypothetical protein